jgi:hypothetical protein
MAKLDRYKLRNDRYSQEVDRNLVKVDRYKFLLILKSIKLFSLLLFGYPYPV